MTPETAVAVGRAVVAVLGGGGGPAAPLVVIGRDTRPSGDMLACALAAGASAMGAEVRLAGVLPTPGVALLARRTGALAGIVVSASHNPWIDNGIKIFDGRGFKLSAEKEAAMEALIFASEPRTGGGEAPAAGRVKALPEAEDIYISFIKQYIDNIKLNKNINIIVDCANGATFRAAPRVLSGLGGRIETLAVSPDGRDINRECGSQHPEALCRRVVDTGADIGLAFDGDGDRLVAADETGGLLSGDRILAVCARDLLRSGRLANRVVVSTVMSNIGLRIALARMGIRTVAADVGDRRVLELMQREGAVLGGEDSGHTIFLDRHTTGDGILTAVALLEAMAAAGEPLSRLAAVMTPFPQELINVAVVVKPPLEGVPGIVSAIQEAEERLGPEGRVLVRYSGTEAKCRVMVEGPEAEETRLLCERVAGVVKQCLGE